MSTDEGALKEMVAKTGQYGVPVIIVGDRTIVGWNKKEFDQLVASG